MPVRAILTSDSVAVTRSNVVQRLAHLEQPSVGTGGAGADEAGDAAELGFDDGEEAAFGEEILVLGLRIDAAVKLVEFAGARLVLGHQGKGAR